MPVSYGQVVGVTNPSQGGVDVPLTIAGSLTPSGTQNVNLVSPTVVPMNSVRSPSIKGVFVFSTSNVPGVVAANNFLTLFNPVGSGKIVSFGSAFISSTTVSGSTETEPMRGFRITTATAGTLQAASASAKFVTSEPSPVAEIRTGNPTVTLGSAVFNSPPAISSTTASTNVHVIPVPGGLAPFTLVEGEGIVLRTAAGDVDQRWNLSVVWAEI